MCVPFRANVVNITLALRTTRFLDKEHEYMPWEVASKNLDYIFLMFDRSEVYGPILVRKKKSVFFIQNRLKVIRFPLTEEKSDVSSEGPSCSLV